MLKIAKQKSRRPNDTVQPRIDEFIKKINKIDRDYMPNPDSRNSRPDHFKKKRAEWVKKIVHACDNEKRFLSPDKKLALSSYKRELARYRRALVDRGVIDPQFYVMLDRIKEKYKGSASHMEYLKRFRGNIEKLRKEFFVFKKEGLDFSDTFYTDVMRLAGHLEHPSLMGSKMRVTMRQREKVKQEQSTALNEKLTEVKIVDGNEMIYRANQAIESDHYADICCGLGLLTGRRPIEILYYGSFDREYKKSGHMLFSGQAKGKMLMKDAYSIPVLGGQQKIIDAFEKLRELKTFDKGVTSKGINNRTAATLNKHMERVYKRDDLKFYDLRSIYARMCFDKFDTGKVSQGKYFARILGHGEKDVFTARSYEGFQVTWEADVNDLAKGDRDKVREAELDHFDVVKAWRERMEEVREKVEGRAVTRIYEFVMSKLEKEETDITQTSLTKQLGASRPAIKKFLALVGNVAS